MNDAPPIGRLIRERRRVLGISQRDLSEITGVSLHTISNIESGKGNPTVATLTSILNPLGLVLSVGVRGIE